MCLRFEHACLHIYINVMLISALKKLWSSFHKFNWVFFTPLFLSLHRPFLACEYCFTGRWALEPPPPYNTAIYTYVHQLTLTYTLMIYYVMFPLSLYPNTFLRQTFLHILIQALTLIQTSNQSYVMVERAMAVWFYLNITPTTANQQLTFGEADCQCIWLYYLYQQRGWKCIDLLQTTAQNIRGVPSKTVVLGTGVIPMAWFFPRWSLCTYPPRLTPTPPRPFIPLTGPSSLISNTFHEKHLFAFPEPYTNVVDAQITPDVIPYAMIPIQHCWSLMVSVYWYDN